MSTSRYSNPWSDLLLDMYDPNLLWQVAVLGVCLGLGWSMSALIRGKVQARQSRKGAVRWGGDSFAYVMAPVFSMAFIAIAKPILANWHHVNLLRVALPLCASLALIRLAFNVFRRVFAAAGDAGKFLQLSEKVFATIVWIGVALYITGLWVDIVATLEEIVLPFGRNKISVLTISQAAVSVVFTLLLALWFGAMLEDRLMRFDTLHSSLRVVLARLGRALLIFVAVLLSLSLVGIDLTVLSVFGGALGVGIGLGLQKIVSSYVSGFVILLERSLAIGDMVAVDKYSGRVTQINTRYTVLQGLDGIESVIPNELLVSSPVQNYSLTDRSLRLVTHVAVAYDTDIEALLPLLTEATASVDRVLTTPEPAALLLRFGADGLELEIGFWIADPENGRMGVVSEVNMAIWRVLKEKDIKVPYAQREVHLVDTKKI